jgi:hypothetical protein
MMIRESARKAIVCLLVMALLLSALIFVWLITIGVIHNHGTAPHDWSPFIATYFSPIVGVAMLLTFLVVRAFTTGLSWPARRISFAISLFGWAGIIVGLGFSFYGPR